VQVIQAGFGVLAGKAMLSCMAPSGKEQGRRHKRIA
jgi:hypothetical protein